MKEMKKINKSEGKKIWESWKLIEGGKKSEFIGIVDESFFCNFSNKLLIKIWSIFLKKKTPKKLRYKTSWQIRKINFIWPVINQSHRQYWTPEENYFFCYKIKFLSIICTWNRTTRETCILFGKWLLVKLFCFWLEKL